MGYKLSGIRITHHPTEGRLALASQAAVDGGALVRSCKSLLQTRPIYHRCDETIRGHVFCSFLALILRQELQAAWTRGATSSSGRM